MKTILLTGASGFLGRYLLDDLRKKGHKIFALSRQVQTSHFANVEWVQADISDEVSMFRPELLEKLAKVDMIIHAAALYDLDLGHEPHYRHNVVGTTHVLHLARLLKNRPHFAYISTIAIAGDSKGNFTEDMFDIGQKFSDPYASTKFAAENIIRSATDLPSRSIYRLGIVVGSSVDGFINKIDGPYVMQRLIASLRSLSPAISRLKLIPLPYHEHSRLYIIPVNIASDLICTLSEKVSSRNELSTFHVTGGGRGVSVRRAIKAILLHYKIDADPFPLPKIMVRQWLLKLCNSPRYGAEYIYHQWTFSSKNLENELPGYRYPSYEHFSKSIMVYADENYILKETRK